MKKLLKKYEKLCDEMVVAFIGKYYADDEYPISMIDYYWVGDLPGDIFTINDYWWDMEDLINIIRYNPTRKQLFDYYDYRLEKNMDNSNIVVNMKNWLKGMR